MTQIFKVSNMVLVFDLDDTLYKELDYKISGMTKVCSEIERLYGIPCHAEFEKIKYSQSSDLLGDLCSRLQLPLSIKESLLWIYRLHYPEIKLSPDVIRLLQELKRSCRLVILTDGRSITQRLKLSALGLSDIPVYISEEYQSEKPALLRFDAIMHDIPGSRYIYVGDNIAKDFIAPNSLGWKTIGLRDDGMNTHSQALDEIPLNYMPDVWVNSLTDIVNHLC